MSKKPVFEVSPETAKEIIAETRRALPRDVQIILREFFLERIAALGLLPSKRDRFLGTTSPVAITGFHRSQAKYG